MEFPLVDAALVAACAKEVTATPAGDRVAQRAAELRLAWALVHSERNQDLLRGVEMLNVYERNAPSREVFYLLAVAHFRLRDFPRARENAASGLRLAPSCRQCRAIHDAAGDTLAEDALLAAAGVGVVAVAAGLVALLASAGRRR